MIIKEFLPNPVGADKDGEYIKIFNDSDKAVSLTGWKISDASKKEFSLSGIINSKEELVLFSTKTKISLNNNGEIIFLSDSKGMIIDQLSYSGTLGEGKIITSQKLNTAKPEIQFENGQVLNKDLSSSTGKVLALDVFLGMVLGLIAVYVILESEKKLDKKLY